MAAADETRLRVALVTLGCARNEVDSEELAGRLAADGWDLVDDAATPTPSWSTPAASSSRPRRTRSTPCSRPPTSRTPAARRPSWPSAAWPSATATSSPSRSPRPTPCSGSTTTPTSATGCAGRGGRAPRRPRAARPAPAAADLPDRAVRRRGGPPGHGQHHPAHPGRRARPARGRGARQRPPRRTPAARVGGPTAPLKLASGCDRRCAFCAIPSFRGSFVSRRPGRRAGRGPLARRPGRRELVLVSENSTSYGKDLGDLRLLETLLPELAAVDGIDGCGCPTSSPPRPGRTCSRSSPRRPASCPTSTSPSSTRAERCCAGCAGSARPSRSSSCSTGARARPGGRHPQSNVIVGFPGETEDDLDELERFLTAARLDVVGVFGYSDEDGTEAADLRRQARPGRRARAGRAGRAGWSRSSPRSARGPRRRDGRGARRGAGRDHAARSATS
jgi:ribosomal protein S12 methylthiotransferase